MDIKGYNGWDPKQGDYKVHNKDMARENLLIDKKRRNERLLFAFVILVLISGAVFFFYNYSHVK